MQKLTDEHVKTRRRALQEQGVRDPRGLRSGRVSARAWPERPLRLLVRPPRDEEPRLPEVASSVALIMDGNGRWAKRRGLPRARRSPRRRAGAAAHRRGRDRPRRRLARRVRVLDRELDAPARRGRATCSTCSPRRSTASSGPRGAGRARALRRPPRPALGRRCAPRSRSIERSTAENSALDLYVCFDYGGRDELVDGRAQPRARRASPADDIDEHALRARLYEPRLPDPDLVIRSSGGEPRLELPALPDRLRRARLQRRALARLRPRGARGGAARVRGRRRRFGGR